MAEFRPQECLPTDRTWIPVTNGESGARVFNSADGSLHAKCVPAEAASDLAAERDRTRWLAAQGLPGAEPVDWSIREVGACLVTTTVPGVPASELTPSALLEALPSLVMTVRRLHDLPVDTCPFDRRLAGMFRRASEVVAAGRVIEAWLRPEQQGRPHPALLSELRTELPGRLEQEATDLVVCHGDACLPNFLVDPASSTCTGLIDLGRLGTADRQADLALVWASASDHLAAPEVATAARILTDTYGRDSVDAARLRFYLYLDPLTW